jgi:hypothetical protein
MQKSEGPSRNLLKMRHPIFSTGQLIMLWENLLDYHSSLSGNSFTNWNNVPPRHNAFVQKILQSPVHIIATIRTKQNYVLSEKIGKAVPEKMGLRPHYCFNIKSNNF